MRSLNSILNVVNCLNKNIVNNFSDEDDENDDEFLKKFSSLDKLESSFTFETEESKRSRLDNWQPSTLQIDSLNI